MKAIIIFFYLFIPIIVSAQQIDTSLFYATNKPGIHFNGDSLIPGFYNSYQEFLDNSPSQFGNAVVYSLQYNQKMDSLGAVMVKIELDDSATITLGQNLWGYCDGQFVYKVTGTFDNLMYNRINYYGPYSYYLEDRGEKKTIIDYVPFVMGAGVAINAAVASLKLVNGINRTNEHLVNLYCISPQDNIRKVTREYLIRLFSKEPLIKKSFMEEKDLGKSLYIKYLTLFNETLIKNMKTNN